MEYEWDFCFSRKVRKDAIVLAPFFPVVVPFSAVILTIEKLKQDNAETKHGTKLVFWSKHEILSKCSKIGWFSTISFSWDVTII